ncbi:MAG: hypothetical protein IKE55_08475 [Kiritimatiellae bacterium]|nr:hypothetical protein [Kiritimatiellia bacterium]
MTTGKALCGSAGKALLAATALLACPSVFSADAGDRGTRAANLDFERGEEGWRLPPAYSVAKGAGMNGTSALVYENADPKLPYAFPSQKIRLEPGQTYRFSAWIRTEGLKPSNVHGATLGIEWSDANGRHLGGSYTGGLKGTTDWTRLEGVTTAIPENAASFTFIPYCTAGCVGKAYFDDMEVVPYERPVVGHLLSSAYRNTADRGRVEFRVGLALPGKHPPEGLKAEFSYEAPDGSGKTVPAHGLSRSEAMFALAAEELKLGRSVVTFRLTAPDGSVLGETQLSFNRVAKMPSRRVWIDGYRRTIVDGRPFFPLGMYTGTASRRAEYVKGPFNCVMPYQAPDAVGMDFYWTNGVMVIYSVKDVYAGANHTPATVTSEDAADSYVQAKVDAFRSHPGLLAWYVNDELVGDGWHGMLTRRRDFLERADPDHPTWAVIYQLQFLREMTPTFDVIGTDPYPVPDKALSLATDWTRKTDRAFFGLRPMWQVPQAFDWGGYRPDSPGSPPNRMPTVDEMRSMSWQCVASGANGLVYYSFTAIQKESHGLPFARAWADVCRVGEEVRRYIPVLLSVEPAPTVAGVPAAWGVRTWRKDGATWLLAVNAQDTAGAAELTLSEGFSEVAAEFGPAAATTGARTIRISLAPNEPALYRIK